MDFLNHLLDAPLSNLLIVAGLLFLGVAAVGKVVGKIEPDKTGRIVSGLLGFVLFFGGVSIHILSDLKKDHPKTEQSGPIQPMIHVFSVTPAHISKGGKVTIHWEVLNADNVELEPFGKVTAAGSATDEPQETTIYRLSATNKGGGKQDTFQQVFVNPSPQTAREPARPRTTGAPAEREIETVRATAVAPVPSQTQAPVATTAPTPTAVETVKTLSSVPNFAGTWKMTEHTRNGMPQPIPSKPTLTITQNGARIGINSSSMSVPISRDGTVTYTMLLAQDYHDGHPVGVHPVKTETEADEVRTITLSFEGTALISHVTWNYKAYCEGHPPGFERGNSKYVRVSTGDH